MNSKSEHRSYPRADNKIDVIYYRDLQSEKYHGISKDFSATGISFSVTEDFSPGEIINLDLTLPYVQTGIHTNGTVIRNWENDNTKFISVQFFDIEYHDFIVLLDYSLVFQVEK